MRELERVAKRAESAASAILELLFACVSRIAASRAHSPTPSDARWLQSAQACVLTAFGHLYSDGGVSASSGCESLRRELSAALGAFLSLLVRSSRVLAAPPPLPALLLLALTAALRAAAQTQAQTPFSALWPLLRPAVQLAADLVGPQALDSDGAQRAAGARLATAFFEALDLLLERTQPSAWHLFRIVQMACLQGCYSLASRVLQAHMGFSSASRAGDFAGAAPSVSSHLRDWLRALSLVCRAESRLADCAGDATVGESDAPASPLGLCPQRAIADARALYEEAHPLLLAAAHSMPAGALSAAQTHLQLRATQLAAARLPLLEQVAQMLAKYASRLTPPTTPAEASTHQPAPRALYSAGDLARLSRLAASALQISEQYAALLLDCVDADGDTIAFLQKYWPLWPV